MNRVFIGVALSLSLIHPAFSQPAGQLWLLDQFDGRKAAKPVSPILSSPAPAQYKIIKSSGWNWPAFLLTAGGVPLAYHAARVPYKGFPAAGLSFLAGAGTPWWLVGSMGFFHLTSSMYPSKNFWGRIWRRMPFTGALLTGTYLAIESMATNPNSSTIAHAHTEPGQPPLKVSFIGDSLAKDFHVSSPFPIAWQTRTHNQYDWVLDTQPGGIHSLFERLGAAAPVTMTSYARVGACVNPSNIEDGSLPYQVCKVKCFSSQVDQLLAEKEFPDLILLWIGHNNIDWTLGANAQEIKNPEARLEKITATVESAYAIQLSRLVEAAGKQNKKTAIVVLGLINFESFFQARASAEKHKKSHPESYPYLEEDYHYFESMKPEYRGNMIHLAVNINRRLEKLVRQTKLPPQVYLSYSDALAKMSVPLNFLHSQDAWHASPTGHTGMAQAAYQGLRENGVLEFLGIIYRK